METKKYEKLEQAATLLRKRLDDRSIRGVGIRAYAMAHALMRDEGLELASALHITGEARAELSELVKKVVKPIEMNIFVLREKLGIRRSDMMNIASESVAKLVLKPLIIQYQCDDKLAVSTFVMNYNGIMELEHVQDKKNIKAAIIFPQTVTIMTTWLYHRVEFANALINAMRSNETDIELKQAIDAIAQVNPLYKIVRPS